MGNFAILIYALLVCHSSATLYSSNSDVIELTESNFNRLVTQSDDIWIVEFYAPWCGYCQRLVPEYAKVAKGLKGVVKVGGVNADEQKSLGGRFSISGFPTIKIFGYNKNSPEDYDGPRTAAGIVDAGMTALRNKVNAQMGLKSQQSSGKTADSNDVIELTDSNFDSNVLKSDDMWLVEFYAPWCGHCKNLAPKWARAATELKGKVKLGALDATVHTIKANEYQVKGYPTIRFFPPGAKDKNSVEDYNGGRETSDIVTWVLEKLSENVKPPEIKQLVNGDVLKEECVNKPLCVISVLPHILDCQSGCRNSYIETLTKLGEKFKKKLWGWVWCESGSQPELESALDIGGFGYPAMAVINAKKMKFSILRGSFSLDGISEFLRDLSYGRGSTAPLKGSSLPKVVEVDPWDGKDGELPQEEDIDLSDVDLDSKDEL